MAIEELEAWQSRALSMCPVGIRFEMIQLAYVKSALTRARLTDGERIELLSQITTTSLPRAAVEAVEPFCEAAMEIVQAAGDIDPDDAFGRMAGGYDALVERDTFRTLCELNSSFYDAMALMSPNLPPRPLPGPEALGSAFGPPGPARRP